MLQTRLGAGLRLTSLCSLREYLNDIKARLLQGRARIARSKQMIDTYNLGKKIACARRSCGMTQTELAQMVGVTAQAVSKWERGSSCPDISILDEVANALGVSVSELLGVK